MLTPTALRDAVSSGVIGFPVTPFGSDGALDLDGLRRNVDAMAGHGFCALVAAGGTGELYSLDAAEHRAVVQATVEAARGRMPIIAGAGGSLGAAREQAAGAAAAGAAGILALPPYYPGADESGLADYYAAIGRATPLGMLVYSRDWVNPGAAFIKRLADLAPTLMAWKDGQGDVRRLQILMASVGPRLLWIGGAGDDLVGAYYRTGIRTYTSSISNVAPRLSLTLHELAAAGDERTLQPILQEHVVPLYALRARRKGYEVSAMKAMMELAGLSGGPVRPPLVEVTQAERDELKQMLDGWKTYL
jgi:5-dehydro-4-deoxyglucarate dehydratase